MDFQKEKKEIEHCKIKYHGKEDTDSATLKLRGEISQPSIAQGRKQNNEILAIFLHPHHDLDMPEDYDIHNRYAKV